MRSSVYLRPPKPVKIVNSPLVLKRPRNLFSLLLKFFLIFLLLYLTYFFLFQSKIFLVSHIQINQNSQFVSSLDVKVLLDANLLGKNIFLIDSSKISKKILSNFLAIKSISIKRQFPSKLEITYQERLPFVLVSRFDSVDVYVVDREGFVLGSVSSTFENLPLVKYQGDILVGQFLDKSFMPLYFEFFQGMSAEKLKASSISVYESTSSLFLTDGTEIILKNDKDKSNAFKAVSSLLKKISTESKKIAKIDLRYDKVIVSYE